MKKQETAYVSAPLSISDDDDFDVESFVYSNTSRFNIAKYLHIPGYKLHFASKMKIDGYETDYENYFVKGFRDCLIGDHPEIAKRVMGISIDEADLNRPITFKEMVLMKIPEKRFNKFKEYYKIQTDELKKSADINVKSKDRNSPFGTFNESTRGKTAIFGE